MGSFVTGSMFGFHGSPFGAVTGSPYSAEQVTEQVQTLADGTHITQSVATTMLYRDSAGRTRTEHMFTPPGAGASAPVFVDIIDPVAGFRYTLNQRNHTAQRMAWPPAMHRAMQANGTSGTTSTGTAGSVWSSAAVNSNQTSTVPTPRRAQPESEVSDESLGTQVIDGISAQGTRNTVTYAVGVIGNDRPITTVSETWTSPELHQMVLSKMSDPRYGETTTRLTNVSQTEPDAALFQVPADYTIEEQPQPSVVR